MLRASAMFRVAFLSVFVVVLMFSFVGVANTATPAKDEGLLVVNSSTNNSDSPSYFGEGVRVTVSAVKKDDGMLYNCSWKVERWSGSDVFEGWPRSAEVDGSLCITLWADEYEMFGTVTENVFYGFSSGPFTSIGASAGSGFYSSDLGCTSCNTGKAQLP
ncbi:hypothetical protein [Candidatus Bathycorpusculum sp.]|uniref:hypothetical protein n=1 Tax=Candidatus Bathycorpusculum sp. TaxID=2994959 RepID=UPI0028199E22|nr:hypothetical protein [Candidatus Termitimicrobium sp.]